jgi:hypothetical protein
MKSRALFFIFLLTLTLAGCAALFPPSPEQDMPAPEILLNKIHEPLSGHETLKASGRITVTAPNLRYSLKVAVMARQPACLRIEEIPSFFSSPGFFLTVNGDSMKIFLPNEGDFFVGKAKKKHLAKLIPLSLELKDLISLLFGIPPASDITGKFLKISRDGSFYRIDALEDERKRASFWIDPEEGRLARAEVLQRNGEALYTAILDKPVRIGTASIPTDVFISFAGPEKKSLSIHFMEIELSKEENIQEDFDLVAPPGITPKVLE